MKHLHKLLLPVLFYTSVYADEPQRLTSLREAHDKASQALDKKYVDALRKLKSDYAKGGDRKAESAVLKEIEEITGEYEKKNELLTVKKTTFTDWLKMVSFRDSRGMILTVKDKNHIEIDTSSSGGQVYVLPLTEVNDKRRTFIVTWGGNLVRKYRVKSTLKSAEIIASEKGKSKEEIIVIPRKKSK